MPQNSSSDSQGRASDLLHRLTHAVLLRQGAAIPLSVQEVTEFDARFGATTDIKPPHSYSMSFSWEQRSDPEASALGACYPTTNYGFAMAARSEESVSEASRSKLARLMTEVQKLGDIDRKC